MYDARLEMSGRDGAFILHHYVDASNRKVTISCMLAKDLLLQLYYLCVARSVLRYDVSKRAGFLRLHLYTSE